MENLRPEKGTEEAGAWFRGVISNSHLKVIGITGIRRYGKSSILIMLQQELIKKGENAAYVNLEDSRIKDNKTVLDDVYPLCKIIELN